MYCSTVRQVILQSTEEGGIIELRNGFGDLSVRLNGSTGSARFTGPSEVASTLNVSSTVTCQNLSAWGEKSRIVRPASVPSRWPRWKRQSRPLPTAARAAVTRTVCATARTTRATPRPLTAARRCEWLATPTSPGALWVEGIDGGAVVHGQPGQTFAWLCLGAQAGYAGSYAEPCHDDPPKPEDPGRVLLGISTASRSATSGGRTTCWKIHRPNSLFWSCCRKEHDDDQSDRRCLRAVPEGLRVAYRYARSTRTETSRPATSAAATSTPARRPLHFWRGSRPRVLAHIGEG